MQAKLYKFPVSIDIFDQFVSKYFSLTLAQLYSVEPI